MPQGGIDEEEAPRDAALRNRVSSGRERGWAVGRGILGERFNAALEGIGSRGCAEIDSLVLGSPMIAVSRVAGNLWKGARLADMKGDGALIHSALFVVRSVGVE
jgi:hypothetical protein